MELAIYTFDIPMVPFRDIPVLPRPEEAIPELKAAGVTAIEAGYHFFITNPERVVEKNSQLFRQAGIRIWSVHAPFGDAYNLAHPDALSRRHAVEYHKFVLERVALAGAALAVIRPGAYTSEQEVPQMLPLLLDSLEELLPVTQRLGVRLALKNVVPQDQGLGFQALRYVVEKMGSQWLGVCFDTDHAHMAGGVKAGMEILKDFIITFHLADNDGTVQSCMWDHFLQPPYGVIPWHEFLSVFHTIDFTSPIVVKAIPWTGEGNGQLLREVSALLQGQLMEVELNGMPTKVRCLSCGHLRFGTVEDNWCACL